MNTSFIRNGVAGAIVCLSAYAAAASNEARISGSRFRVTFAPGQSEYVCQQGLKDRKEPACDLRVYAWMIPDMKGSFSGCVAAFPYKSLRVISPADSGVPLVWKLYAVGSPKKLIFDKTNGGIAISRSDTDTPVDPIYSGSTTEEIVAQWTVTVPPGTQFLFRHAPAVGYYSDLGVFQACVPIDPIIKNESN